MPKVYVIGNFQTGATSESQILPVVKGSDEITLNINNEDFATLQVSKRDLPDPAAWKTYLKPIYTMVTAIDTDKAWNAEGAILFSGFIKEVKMGVKETINIQVAGMREYASMRQPTNVYSGNVTDPEAGVTFQGSTDQHLMIAMMRDIWNSYSQGSTVPRPPTTIGTPSVSPNTGTKQYKTKNSEFLYTSDYLDDLRDNISLNGNEYRYVPRWASNAKNTIVWDQIVGTDAAPQINLATQTFNVNLDNNDFVTGASNSLTSTDYATRLIGVSIIGDEETPSDMRIITSGEPNTILVDSQFNPQVELSSALLDSQMSARINFMKKVQESGEVMVVRNASEQWITRVGGTVVMSAGGTNPDTSGLNISTRLVETKFNLSDTTVKTMIMSFKPKYGKLPNSPTNPNKFPNPGGGGFTPPIIPKLPDNVPTPGGGGPVVPTIPDFEVPPPYENNDNIWKNVTNGQKNIGAESISQEASWHLNNRLYSLNVCSQMNMQLDSGSAAQPPYLPGHDIKIWTQDLSGTTSFATVPNPTLVGSLPYSTYSSELITPYDFTLGNSSGFVYTKSDIAVLGGRVYIFLTSYQTELYRVTTPNDVINRRTKAKSIVYSAPLTSPTTIGSWTKESWDLTDPADSSQIMIFTSKSVAPSGVNSDRLNLYGYFVMPKDNASSKPFVFGIRWLTRRVNQILTINPSTGTKSYGENLLFLAKGIDDNPVQIICGYDNSGNALALSNSSDTSTNQVQIFQTTLKQNYNVQFQLIAGTRATGLPKDAAKYCGLGIFNNWIILDDPASTGATPSNIFRSKVSVVNQVIKNKQNPVLIGGGLDPYNGNRNYFSAGFKYISVDITKAPICLSDFVTQFDIPVNNGYCVTLQGGYTSVLYSVGQIAF